MSDNGKKNTVLFAKLKMSNYMVKHAETNSVLSVKNVIKLIFGKREQINTIANSTGLSYGLMKVIRYGNSVFFLGIVNQNYIALRIIGLILNRKILLIFLNANTLCTMELIFIRRGVLLA